MISGVWYFGYGGEAKDAAKKALLAGSFYSEPAGVAHFAETKDEPAVVMITGYGPSDTEYTEPGYDRRARRSSRVPGLTASVSPVLSVLTARSDRVCIGLRLGSQMIKCELEGSRSR